MKILFVADHHIKLGQRNVPREWARNRFALLWGNLAYLATEHNVDAIMHGGDIFDRVPTPEETGIMLDMFKVLQGPWRNIVYPGNHEATSKFKSFWEEFQALKHERIEIVLEFMELEPGVHILPYTDLKKKDWHGTEGKLLFTHVRGEIPPHVKPEIELSLFDTWDKVIAGDLHAHSNSQRNIVYPGSPITTSFHRRESKGENGVLIVDTSTCDVKFLELRLPQLIRATVESEDDMVRTDYHHTVYELVGDASDLSTTKPNDLLDKKIINRDVDATMTVKDMSIEEELSWFLHEVECIKDDKERQSIVDEYVNIKRASLE